MSLPDLNLFQMCITIIQCVYEVMGGRVYSVLFMLSHLILDLNCITGKFGVNKSVCRFPTHHFFIGTSHLWADVRHGVVRGTYRFSILCSPSGKLKIYDPRRNLDNSNKLMHPNNRNVVYSFADGSIGLSILPLAVLLTGILLTVGIGLLMVVVFTIRKRRDPVPRSMCDDKDKHIGK